MPLLFNPDGVGVRVVVGGGGELKVLGAEASSYTCSGRSDNLQKSGMSCIPPPQKD